MREGQITVRATPVRYAHPAIRAIVDMAFEAFGMLWTGRTVTVVETNDVVRYATLNAPTNNIGQAVGYAAIVMLYASGTPGHADAYVVPSAAPREVPFHAGLYGSKYADVIVIWTRGSVQLVIQDVLDGPALEVAIDALLVGGKPRALERQVTSMLATCGPYAGIAAAVAYGKAKIIRVRQETNDTILESRDLGSVNRALRRLGNISHDERINLILAHGGMAKIADMVCRRIDRTVLA